MQTYMRTTDVTNKRSVRILLSRFGRIIMMNSCGFLQFIEHFLIYYFLLSLPQLYERLVKHISTMKKDSLCKIETIDFFSSS